MPPRRKSAPAGRVYKSATPLQQTKLPKQKKHIKSYGKQLTRRAKEDNTLTQIGFVKLENHPEEGDEGDEDQEESDYEEAAKKRKTKRRKTSGDQPSATPSWHTQTITQLEWSFSTNNDVEEEVEEDVHGQRSIFDVPSSSPLLPRTNVQNFRGPATARPSRREESPILGDDKSPLLDMPPPQTPRRVIRQEIPSSQSPATPLSIQSRRPPRQLSPLKEKSINVPIPFSTSPRKRPQLKIEDTYESGNTTSQAGESASSPNRRPSPAKSVRFALQEDQESPVMTSIKQEKTPFPSRVASQPNVKLEILDSDDEDEDYLEEDIAITFSRIDQANQSASISEEQDDEPESCYGDIGKDTQFEADRIVSSVSDRGPSDTLGHTYKVEQSSGSEEQIGETQRLSTQHLNMMAPRTENSDIFISIHPQHVTNIINRTKNHEFRTWAIPPSVCRMWIYETKPVAALKYMANISSAKRPGDIIDQDGLGNADFNAKPGDKHHNAYEILQLYELADPVPLARIISNGWMKAAPQRFAWVGPAVADELIANLKPPLFVDMLADIHSSPITDTQEVEEQLLNTISQFTQPLPPSHPTSSQHIAKKTNSMKPRSSVDQDSSRKQSSPPGPSQAETVDLSQVTRPPTQDVDDEVILESPARPVPSSSPLKLPTPRAAASGSHGRESVVPYSMFSSSISIEEPAITRESSERGRTWSTTFCK